MRVKWYIFSLLLFIFMILCFNSKLYAAESHKNLFDDIISETGSRTVEYGVNTSFRIKENGTAVCSEILKNLNLEEDTKVTSFVSGSLYKLNFENKDISGYIESADDEDGNIIKIDVIKYDSSDNLMDLKAKIGKSVEKYDKAPVLFLYLKAKTPEFDTEHTNRTIVSLLKKGGTIDIDTVDINKGISTVCYTGRFKPTMINGKLIDFNFAVTSYNSGSYIIMGTPEILEIY